MKERSATFIESTDTDDYIDEFEFEKPTDEQDSEMNESINEGLYTELVGSDCEEIRSEMNESVHDRPNSGGSENMNGEENVNNESHGQDRRHKETRSSFEDWESSDTNDYKLDVNETEKSGVNTKETNVSDSAIHKPVTLDKVLGNIIMKHLEQGEEDGKMGSKDSVSLAEEHPSGIEEQSSDTYDYEMNKLVIKIEDTDVSDED